MHTHRHARTARVLTHARAAGQTRWAPRVFVSLRVCLLVPSDNNVVVHFSDRRGAQATCSVRMQGADALAKLPLPQRWTGLDRFISEHAGVTDAELASGYQSLVDNDCVPWHSMLFPSDIYFLRHLALANPGPIFEQGSYVGSSTTFIGMSVRDSCDPKKVRRCLLACIVQPPPAFVCCWVRFLTHFRHMCP